MILPYIASSCLGIIVGWLIWTFVHRTNDLTVKAITSLASLAAGGVVIAAASWGAKTGPGDAVYTYPIGALIAIVVLGLLSMDTGDAD
jgi:peptidoglycan/LPS O-acetylase OafA/YrhL